MSMLIRLRRYLIVVSILVLAAVLVSCGGSEVPISGTVIDDYSGKPVAGATVSLGGTQLTTDASGKYQLASWTKRDTLQIAASGYEPRAVNLAEKPELASPTPPAVTLDWRLRPNTISGILTDVYTGKPIAGALVKATDTLSATTAADGRYTIAGVPESFTLTVSAKDYETASQTLKKTIGFDAALRPTSLSGTVTDRYTGQPVAAATVKIGDTLSATTAADGKYRLEGLPKDATVEISADGYAILTQPVEKNTVLDVVLRPDVLKGKLVDSKTGTPIQFATVIATPSAQTDAVAQVRIEGSADGSFKLDGVPEQGLIEVLAPGYRKTTIAIKPGSVPSEIKLDPFASKALYVTAAVAANWDLMMQYFDSIDKTELNTIVIDLKSDLRDDLGLVYYDSQVPLVKQLGISRPYVDMQRVLAEAKKRGIYTIARTHIFSHDNALAEAKPEWAAKDKTTGGVFADYPGPGIHYDWLDPWNHNVWDYNIQIAVEAAHLGFDEINFDYIRFPSLEFATEDKDRLQLSRPNATDEEKYANIVEMLKQSQQAINGAGAFLSVDVFGVAAWQPASLIGQDIARMGQYTDYVCPMIYPSHFWAGAAGFDNPAQHPYEIIKESMRLGQEQMNGRRAKLRPWLQDFTLTWVPKNLIVEYGPAEVRAQITAVEEDSKSVGWQLYDSANQYTIEALNPQ